MSEIGDSTLPPARAMTQPSSSTRTVDAGGTTSGGRAYGVASVVGASIVPAWALIATIAGSLTTLAWLPVLLVYVIPYNLVYSVLLVAATTLGIVATRRRPGRRLGQAGLIIIAIQVIAVVGFTVWALIDHVPA